MKRVSWAAAVGLMVGAGASPSAAAQWSPGVAVGGTFGNATGAAVGTSASRWGGSVGVNLTYMGRSFIARVEGNYVGRGGDQVVLLGLDSTSLNYGFTYVDVPLLMGPVFDLGEAWMWELFTGLQVGFNTSCTVTLGTSGTGASDCAPDLPGGLEQSMVVSLPLGTSLDYQIPGGRTRFVFDVRYYFGLSDALQDATVRTSGFQFLLRLQFGG